jgi:hypothetical protein
VFSLVAHFACAEYRQECLYHPCNKFYYSSSENLIFLTIFTKNRECTLAGRDDRLVHGEPLLEMFGKWDEFLSRGLSEGEVEKDRCHERAGRPLSADSFGCIPDFL